MSVQSIILDPKKMFETLQELENHTKEFIKTVHELAEMLQEVALLTYAIGFNELTKKAESELNHMGSAVVAVNNAVNTACADVVNELVKKFVSFAGHVDYGSPPFQLVHLKVNPADRTAIFPSLISDHLYEIVGKGLPSIGLAFALLEESVYKTKQFWVGQSADRVRYKFKSRVVPEFSNLIVVVNKIIDKGLAWVAESVKFEAALKTP